MTGYARDDVGLVRDVVADYSERILRMSGRRIDMSTSFVEATMPDGSRLHVVLPVSTRTADTSAGTHGRRRR
jgi:Flp pilus assembly CpaF family ATPase